MPARVAHPPGRVPLQGLVLKLGLGEPQGEVVLVALVGVLLHPLPHAHGQVLLVVVVKDVIVLQLGGVKVHVAPGEVGVALVHQGGDDADIVLHHPRGRLDHVWGLDVQLAAVVKKGVGVESGDLQHPFPLPLGPLEHLVLAGVRVPGQVAHVGDVHHPVHVVALIAQVLLQHVLHDIGAQVADVGIVVHRGPAGVHLHPARGMGAQGLLAMGGGIVQIHGASPTFPISTRVLPGAARPGRGRSSSACL